MQELIEKISEFGLSLSKSPKQKKYFSGLVEKLILEINILNNRIEKATGFNPNEYDKYLTRTISLLNLLGFDNMDFVSGDFSDEFINFIMRNRKELKPGLTFKQIRKTAIIYRNYKVYLNKEPKTLHDLKNIDKEFQKDIDNSNKELKKYVKSK